MTPWLLIALGLAGAGADLPAAWQHWHYARPVELQATSAARLVKATLPPEVYGRAQMGLGDLRVIDDTGTEVPFVLQARRGRKGREWVKATLGEVSFVPRPRGTGFTQALLETGADAPAHNSLEINVTDSDFIARVEVAVSDDGRQWRILRQAVPIYKFEDRGLPGNQQVSYSETRARYLRLRITRSNGEPITLAGCRVAHEVIEEPELVRWPARFASRPDAPAAQSWWRADLGSGQVPASEVRFQVDQEQFHRPVKILSSEDGENWLPAGTGSIHRYTYPAGDPAQTSLQVAFNEARGRYWQVVVVNRNDPSLEGVRLELYGTPRHVVFRQEPRRTYRLLYHNESAHAPDYELARLADRAELESALAVSVGAEVVNTSWADPRPWSERHPLVLWVALGIVVVVLGLLAIRTLRQPS